MKRSTDPKILFWACFIALVATSFGFIIRASLIDVWALQFNLSETQKGEILGVGLWPFAITIVLFSLVVDKIGYGRAMAFAFLCHVSSAVITIFARDYWALYIGQFIVALGAGTVEAVINPVVATIFSKDKTKWLNILHAGWPGGMVLGGLFMLIMGPAVHWKFKVALLLIPAFFYGVMMLRCSFPVQERVKAGIPYKTMLQEAGIVGAAIIVWMMTKEVGRVFDFSSTAQYSIIAVVIIAYSVYVRALGRPLFIFLMFIMIPLAIAELGTDSWITDLVNPVMSKIGIQPIWVLMYTAFIMMILRFNAGPVVHRLSPLGMLASCSVIAILGLIFLSKSTGIMIFVAATVYGIGKSFFWPTMLGVVSERFPKGGALTMNMISGVAMLAVGVIGAAFLGNIQDKQIDRELERSNPALHRQVVAQEKSSVFGVYRPLDQEKVVALTDADKGAIQQITWEAKKSALFTVAIFPTIMLICYIILIIYFRSIGGYKPVLLEEHSS